MHMCIHVIRAILRLESVGGVVRAGTLLETWKLLYAQSLEQSLCTWKVRGVVKAN